MKRLITLTIALFAALVTVSAQNYIVVDSKKIFKSISEYNEALATLDELAQQEQQRVDAKFAEVETLYNNYMSRKNSLSASARQAQEELILQREQEAQQFQESIFGNEGTLMKRRVELIQPIQRRVFSAIESCAKQLNADMVVDKASNPTILYVSEAADKTQVVIDMLK